MQMVLSKGLLHGKEKKEIKDFNFNKTKRICLLFSNINNNNLIINE